ncbi:MAG: M15 family metallopeptidase [Alloacidobacterium sp.]|jgi:hypothetical protein
MVAAMKAQGLTWGGDWIHFKDEDHFQMPNVPANPDALMIADYEQADGASLQAIWANADVGKYQA